MRYEFRGKDWDDEWQEGSLMEFEDGACAILTPTSYAELVRRYVSPETVGRHTGLHDKNGTKIFEGDLVRFVHPDTGEFSEEVQEVVWDDKYVGFCLLLRATGYKESFDGVPHWYVVIGNIHDNPELVST